MSALRLTALVVLVACRREAPPPREAIVVSVSSPAFDAARMDVQVVTPLESMIMRAPKVTRVVGRSEDGFGTIRVEGDVSAGQVRSAIELQALPAGTRPEVLLDRDWPRLGGYTLRSSRLDIVQLRAWHDQTVRTPLYTLAGVRNVAVCGGGTGVRATEIRVDIERLAAFGLRVTDVIEAVRRAPRDHDELRKVSLAGAHDVPVTLADVATRAVVAPSDGCRAYDASGPVVSVEVYGESSARALVRDAIAKIAGPDVEVVKTPEVKQLVIAMAPEHAAEVARRVVSGIVRTGAPGWLGQDIVLDVPADRADALRDQLAAELRVGILEPGRVAWLFRDGADALVADAARTAAQVGSIAPPTAPRRELVFDGAAMTRTGIALTQEQRRDLEQLVNAGVVIDEDMVVRIAADADLTRIPVGVGAAGVVPLGVVATITTAAFPRSIWRIDARAALPVRLLPLSPRAALDALARDPSVTMAPLVHLP